MKSNNYQEIRDLKSDAQAERFENDYDYPWDENYTTGIFNIDGIIKRSFNINELVTASKKY